MKGFGVEPVHAATRVPSWYWETGGLVLPPPARCAACGLLVLAGQLRSTSGG
jgi:hypothetical protein